MLAGGLILLLVWNAEWDWRLWEHLPSLERPIVTSTQEPVMVMLVGNVEGVDAVRAAVDPDRIVASTPEAFALIEGRIVATSIAAASGPLNRAGWASRNIEIVVSPQKLTPGFAKKATASGAGRPEDPFAALKDEDSLTSAQSLKLLKAMDQRGDF